MKKLLVAIVWVFLFGASALSVTYNSNPKIFISELISDAMKTINDKSISTEDKTKFLEKIALENVDIKALGMYTLGDIRKTLDPETLKEYNKLFEKYFLKSLTSRLIDYKTTKFEVTDAEQTSSNYTIVKSRIPETSSQQEIKIDWRVYTKNPEKPLIRDLIIEGLSLARTQKEEFSSIINSNNGDIDSLLKTLEDFAKD